MTEDEQNSKLKVVKELMKSQCKTRSVDVMKKKVWRVCADKINWGAELRVEMGRCTEERGEDLQVMYKRECRG